jgi:formyltetrahydrofolate deformylase
MLANYALPALDIELPRPAIVPDRTLSKEMSRCVTFLMYSLNTSYRALEESAPSYLLQSEKRKKRVALLVSKEPHCLQHLIDGFAEGRLHGQVACVLSNHRDLEDMAVAAGLRFFWFPSEDPAKHFDWLADLLKEHAADLVVLARYMRILPPNIVAAYRYKIINIHPSLLPYFPGAAPYRQAFESGVRVHGCTAHFVTEQLDEGPVILQDVFHINVGSDTLDDVKQKGLELEARVLGKAVQLFLDEELVVVEGKVIFKPGISRFLKVTE